MYQLFLGALDKVLLHNIRIKQTKLKRRHLLVSIIQQLNKQVHLFFRAQFVPIFESGPAT